MRMPDNDELWLCVSTLMYFLMNGAQIFETFVIVGRWTANPPHSFHYFRKPYGMDLKTFWIVLHSIHEVTFILAIIFCWHTDVRNMLLLLFCMHFAIRVWTILYFAPNIIDFQKMANSGVVSADIGQRVLRWRNLNYVRVAGFVVISLAMVPLCFRLLAR